MFYFFGNFQNWGCAIMKLCIVFCLILATLSTLVQAKQNKSEEFNPKHVRFMAKIGNNWLFRGSEPLTKDKEFAWTELQHSFEKIAHSMNIVFPKTYQILDVCLDTWERKDIHHESEWFEKHPEKGQFIFRPTYGLSLQNLTFSCKNAGFNVSTCYNPSMQPNKYPENVVQRLAEYYMRPFSGLNTFDWLEDRMMLLNGLLSYQKPTPQIVYVHCECGCDRTGEIAAAYYMRWMGWNFTKSMTYDVSVPHRNIGYKNQVAAQWYCEHLFYSGKYPQLSDCGNCKPFRCNE